MARFYLTTAIDYVNSRPHLGTAYEKVAADVIARFKRLDGFDVRFLMGNDEHSQNVFRKATELGLSPLAYCDEMADEFKRVWGRLDVSFDDFIRTTEPRHKRAVQALIQKSYEAGDIYPGEYEGWYCVSCESFKQEKDLTQDGLCQIHKTKPEWIKEKNYFFRLSKYRDRLVEHFTRHPEFVAPESRRNELLRLLEMGLDDISVSRAGQAWGIPLPFDPASVVYVWYDALINYASAVGYGSDQEFFAEWWPADLHVIGKDITRFHCVVWPAMLMSVGAALPKQVFGHGWLTFKGEKMSKSLGSVVDPLEAAERLGPDPLRWYLTREVAFGQDGDFSWDLFETGYNADLANNLGNLVNRVTSMAHRYRGGRLTGPGASAGRLSERLDSSVRTYCEQFGHFHLSDAAAAIVEVVDAANEMIASTEPWRLAKAGDDRGLDAVLWNGGEALRVAAVLLSPFMPRSSVEILRRLGVDHDLRALRLTADAAWRSDGERTLQQGGLLWPRLEPKDAVAASSATVSTKEPRVTDQNNPNPSATPAAAGPEAATTPAAPAISWPLDARLSIDEFMRIDLRVARVLTAERVPNSKKLMKMEVDLGVERRTIVAGIAEAYEAEALVGRTVAIVANLKPAKLMGIESNGMVLAASPDGGKPMLVAFDQTPPPGTRVR